MPSDAREKIISPRHSSPRLTFVLSLSWTFMPILNRDRCTSGLGAPRARCACLTAEEIQTGWYHITATVTYLRARLHTFVKRINDELPRERRRLEVK